ncbi:hypothetical protein J2S55_001630 [Streptosporangium brasiliense]|uniref:Uncharacterized protein n=1 Tax=Streptosporangium brasiliense TaxID=47480 RepID=A0ABT9R0B7_9ACTN|nr:hypothetical protein [Streptosporangium brasiliense]
MNASTPRRGGPRYGRSRVAPAAAVARRVSAMAISGEIHR